jgi:hypothetical protein
MTDQLQTGIVAQAETGFDVKQSVVENNQITYTGMHRGYGDRDDGVYQGLGISVGGEAYTIRQNVIEDTSHGGIDLEKCEGPSSRLRIMLIRRSLLLLNDGGAIVIGSGANVIRGKFTARVPLETLMNQTVAPPNPKMTHLALPTPPMAWGLVPIRTDADGTVIENNTIANNAHQGSTTEFLCEFHRS